MLRPRAIRITVSANERVSGLLQVPPRASACYVFAHGAGAGMTHPFMAAVADGLAARGIATLRFQFPYMERGSRRPDVPAVAHATIRAAVTLAARKMPKLPLFAGGKSFGGRMTSQAAALGALPQVCGLVFIGFPLHPPKKPSVDRAKHLAEVAMPMLFLQGTRDDLAELKRLKAVVRKLGSRATLSQFEGADHAFHVPAKSGRSDAQVRDELLDVAAGWIKRQL